MNYLFETVKSAVSVPTAAAFYGLNADHSGMIRCLFHPDHNSSMKLYDDHFFCFGCRKWQCRMNAANAYDTSM